MSTSLSSGETRGPQLLAATWTLVCLATLFLGLRLFCKIFRGRGLWWDDYLLVLSWVCSVTTNCFTTAAVGLGYGHHAAELDPANVVTINRYTNIGGTPNMVAMAISKCAFALTLVRLSEGRTGKRMLLFFIIASVSVFMFLANLFLYVRCSPVTKNWDMTVDGTCWDTDVVIHFNTFAGGYSALADFVLAFIGASTVWTLQMRLTEKLGLAIAMSMGVFAGVTGIVKCYYMNEFAFMDYSYDGYDLEVWGLAETTTTIIAASIPVLRVLVIEVREATTGRSPRTGYPHLPTLHIKSTTTTTTATSAGPEKQSRSWRRSRESRTAAAPMQSEKFDSQSDFGSGAATSASDIIIQSNASVIDWGRKQRDEESAYEPHAR